MTLPDTLTHALGDLHEIDDWWDELLEDRTPGTRLRWRENDRRVQDPRTGARTPLAAPETCDDCGGRLSRTEDAWPVEDGMAVPRAKPYCPTCSARPRPTAPPRNPAPEPLGESPAPLSLTVVQALADLSVAIVELERRLCEALGQTPLVLTDVDPVILDLLGPDSFVLIRLRRIIRTINTGVTPTDLEDWVVREAASMRRTLRGALNTREQVQHLKGVPCTICGCFTLVCFFERDLIVCTGNVRPATGTPVVVCECDLEVCDCHRGGRHFWARCTCGRGGFCACNWRRLGMVLDSTMALGLGVPA